MGLYEQAVDESASHVIASLPTLDMEGPKLSPDGSWFVFVGWPPHSTPETVAQLYRVPSGGGVPEPISPAPGLLGNIWCTNQSANFCAYVSRAARDSPELIVTAFDPLRGTGGELLRIPIDPKGYYFHSVSPDGSQVAIASTDSNAVQIRLFSLHGLGTRLISLEDYTGLNSLRWAADGRSLFLGAFRGASNQLLRVDLNGEVHSLWKQPFDTISGIASPDGRRLAIQGLSGQANVWMIENF